MLRKGDSTVPGHPHNSGGEEYLPQLIAWEVTRFCVLSCKHCRAAAQSSPYSGELSTQECFKLLDNIASFAKPIIILTGGEPMSRADIYEIAAHGHSLGLPVVMAPCGVLIDDDTAAKIVQSGISRISISLDGATAESHDDFRGVEGAFDATIRGLEAAKRAGIQFQINTTVTKHNLEELPAIRELAMKLGAAVFNPFFLVPTGRGKELADQEITPEEYEQTLHWLAELQDDPQINQRVTCAPHYQRILRQLGIHSKRPAKGCMGGQSFAFISHRGKVQICGFLDIECGDLRQENLDFRKVWQESKVFQQIRQVDSYHGRCGYCEYRKVCGGCRARAYALTGDYLTEEPYCLYQPKRASKEETANRTTDLDQLDKKILSVIQTDMPISLKPFDVLAERLGVEADEVVARVARLRSAGVIRRLGAVFDSARLGYASTLVAARIRPERLDQVAQLISSLPGVTHNYSRDHEFNLWFTLTVPSSENIEAALEDLRTQTGIADFYSLPAMAVYKIRVDFQLDGSPAAEKTAEAKSPSATKAKKPVLLNENQKQLVRLLQEDLPITAEPFAQLAGQLDSTPEEIVRQVADWIDQGVIRRFGAVVRHHLLGFQANGMAVFSVAQDRIDSVGQKLAQHAEISHCYRRPRLHGWDYDLFAMVHGKSEPQVRRIVRQLAQELDLPRYDILFSRTEYKKASMKYFLDAAAS